MLVLFCWAAVGSANALDLKNPPLSGVYDPGRFLDEGFSDDIEYTINYERTHREFEVFLILFEEEPSQGARILAKQAGESWSTGEYWSVVFQVGKDAEPDCLVGGDYMGKLPPELVDRTVRGARGTALLVSTPQNRLTALINSLADEFAFLRVQAKQNYEAAVKEFDKAEAARKKKRETIRAIVAVLTVVSLAVAAAAFLFWKKHLRKLKPMEFPETSPRRRLTAPSSGGGDVLVNYGRKH